MVTITILFFAQLSVFLNQATFIIVSLCFQKKSKIEIIDVNLSKYPVTRDKGVLLAEKNQSEQKN